MSTTSEAWFTHESGRGIVVTSTERSPCGGLELAIVGRSGLRLPLPLRNYPNILSQSANRMWRCTVIR
jgi:hypothetical protein